MNDEEDCDERDNDNHNNDGKGNDGNGKSNISGPTMNQRQLQLQMHIEIQ